MPTLILCYHRVADGVEDPFHLCVSPEHFKQHLTLLGARARFVTLDEAIQPSMRPRVVVTLDDGYADNLSHAAPIARELGVPMTVFVTSGLIGSRCGFWWDRLARVVHDGCERGAQVRLTIGGEPVTAHLGELSVAPQVVEELRQRLLPCSTEEIDDVVMSLAEQLDTPPAAPPDARSLTGPELWELSKKDGVTIGAHTTGHVRLSNGTLEEQSATITTSKRDLEATIGEEVRHFAYPFGGLDAFDENSVSAVRDAGFTTATTTLPGSVGRSPDPLRLRRRVVMDWSPWRFRAQMLRWGLI